jgi:hypothetical protein
MACDFTLFLFLITLFIFQIYNVFINKGLQGFIINLVVCNVAICLCSSLSLLLNILKTYMTSSWCQIYSCEFLEIHDSNFNDMFFQSYMCKFFKLQVSLF